MFRLILMALLALAGCVTPLSMPPPDQSDLQWAQAQWEHALGRETWGYLVLVTCSPEAKQIDGHETDCIGKAGIITYRQGYDQNRRRAIFLHELGHALRVRHNPDPRSVMYFTAPTLTIQPDDLAQPVHLHPLAPRGPFLLGGAHDLPAPERA